MQDAPQTSRRSAVTPPRPTLHALAGFFVGRLGALALGGVLLLAGCQDLRKPTGPGTVDEPRLAQGGGSDVGGEVFSSPGTIGLELRWGSDLENSKEIEVTDDGPYSFGVDLRKNTRFRVFGTSAPDGWACRGKQTSKFIDNDSETETHVYCGTSESTGVRLASWNLEWYDVDDAPEKKQAIADLINQYNFDVMVLNEVLDSVAVNDLIDNHLGDASSWDYRITEAGCSLKQVTLWHVSDVTFESGFELNSETSGGIIDEESDIWDDCSGRRPYVATFSVNDSDVTFTTASIHFKAGSNQGDCELRKDQVDTFVEWVDWAGMDTTTFTAVGDFNDELPGTGICNSVDALATMEDHTSFTFATAQPDYVYSHMMGNGLVTFDTNSFQSTLDHVWANDELFERFEDTVDMFGNRANAVQANMYYSDWGEPDHNPPYVAIQK